MSHRNQLVQAKVDLSFVEIILAVTLAILAFQVNGWWTAIDLFLAAGFAISAAQDINKARKLRKGT